MTRPGSRAAVGVAWSLLALTALTGCGTSPYCQAIEDHQVTLNALGQERTNTAFTEYARAFRAVANVAPDSVRTDWAKLADVTTGVLTAQRNAGIKMEDMLNEKKLTAVPADKLTALNNAYQTFNNTQKERDAVVKNVKDECQITLS